MRSPAGTASGSLAVLVLASALAVIALSSEAGAGIRLDQTVVPTFQDIRLTIDADQKEYEGSTQIFLRANAESDRIQFHAMDMDLTSIRLSGSDEMISTTHTVGERGLVTVTPERPLKPGLYVLDVEFANAFDTTALGLYRLETGGHAYTFTQFEAEEARKAFPCWDQPVFKIPYQLTLTVPETHLAISNAPIEKETTENGWRTVVFEKTAPMPTYILAIATGPFETVPIPGMDVPGRVVTVQGQSHMTEEAVRATPPILKALEEYFGRPYPYKKLDLLAVPEYWYGAMENAGAVTFREEILVQDPETMTAGQRRRMAAVIAHELAHMWFGDLVTMEWWDDLWLNESFASWMGNKIVAQLYPEFKSEVSGVRGAHSAMITDARPSTRVLRQAVENTETLLESADVLAYNKGQAVLEMCERWVGDETFRGGVRDYIQKHEWKNVIANDLWSSLGSASEDSISSSMATFTDQAGVPLVEVSVLLDGRVQLTQKRFSNYGIEVPESTMWKIPMIMKYADASGMNEARVMLSEESQTIELATDGKLAYILPDKDAAGYYRWTVAPEMLAAMAKRATDDLTPRERVSFLGNLSALLDAGAIRGDDFLRVLNEFANDPEPQVVSTMISGLNKVRSAFVTPEYENEFATYVRRTLGPAVERFGLEPRDSEDETITSFRPQLIGWLAEEGQDTTVLAHTEALARSYFEDPESVDPSLVGICISMAARRGDRAMFDEYKSRFENAQTPTERSRFLYALGDFRDRTLVDAALAYSLEGPLRPQESFSIPGSLLDSREYEDYVFDWILDNYDAFTARMPEEFRSFMPFIAGGCSATRLEAAQAFFMEPKHNAPGTEVQLRKVTDQVTDCVSLREREGEAVRQYLRELGSEN